MLPTILVLIVAVTFRAAVERYVGPASQKVPAGKLLKWLPLPHEVE